MLFMSLFVVGGDGDAAGECLLGEVALLLLPLAQSPAQPSSPHPSFDLWVGLMNLLMSKIVIDLRFKFLYDWDQQC